MNDLSRVELISAIIFSCCLLIGCGGGGVESQPGGEPLLQVDVGAAQTVALPDTLSLAPSVTLDGAAAGNQVDYQWRQISGPGPIVLSDPAIASPTATFPVNGSYQLVLDVTSSSQVASDFLDVTVNTQATGASGLSAPPANNVQCVAPANAAVSASIRLLTPYPGLPSLNPLVGLFQAPGDNSVWYALKQTGEVVRFVNDPGVSSVAPFLDIQDRVDYGGEKGLLGMAFHPSYAVNGYVYLSYTASPVTGLESRISRFTLNTTTQTLDPASEQIILTVSQPYSNHNGGQINFGPDNRLYIGLGDGGSGGDPLGHGQNTSTLLGSMLRIDVGDGSGGYTTPPGNPFVSGGGAPEIYAYGLRNPWRWSFDRLSGWETWTKMPTKRWISSLSEVTSAGMPWRRATASHHPSDVIKPV
ncbi:MAG: PQQ-dependent sugar dehydrogenase [Candidatus Thiodiazotropha sp. (ex Gloverina cf. vestifex)]|nr:PQQ-dependent sugar dehydrogenase [Candidatus Thiodiazotropha sp. (ex Gloverina cf. vestifex)]